MSDLDAINEAARALAAGDLSVRVPEDGDDDARELARSFNAMAASLQESERSRDEFFALVSHELRTPLTSIIGYVQLVLDDEALGRDARRFLQIVHRNGQRLLRLVGDMLFVAQVEAGRLSLDREPVAVRAVVVDGVDTARPAAEDVGVHLEFVEDPSGDPDFVVGDRDRLAQALDNLISNALKFSARDADGDRAPAPRADGWVNVEVIDTGDGIPLVEQERLFDRFARSETAIDRGVPGAGLGLAVVKAIVEAHDGSVELDVAPSGAGRRCALRLPLADQARCCRSARAVAVAEAAHGLDRVGVSPRAGLELAAQVADVELDLVGADARLERPTRARAAGRGSGPGRDGGRTCAAAASRAASARPRCRAPARARWPCRCDTSPSS